MDNTRLNKNQSSSSTTSSTTTVVATQLPGIDNSQVIASQPYIVKENSAKEQHREIKLDKG